MLTLIDSFEPAGGETIAINIAVKLKESGTYNPVVCATRGGGELEELLIASRLPYFSLGRSRAYHIHRFYALNKIIKAHNVKIIHSHKTGSNLWASLYGKLASVDAVLTHVHGCVERWQTSVVERFVGRACDKMIAVSESERKRLIQKQGVTADRVVTIYNGIDHSHFPTKPDMTIKRQLGLQLDVPVVGICAGLREEKNHEMFLRAAKAVLSHGLKVNFLIIGDGPRRQALEHLVSELRITRNCYFTGLVRNVPAVLSTIDIGVLCSLREALPLSLLEYMACGKPVIATNIGGGPEVIKEGVNGFLVQTGDYYGLAGRIKLLLENRDLALQMGDRGLSIVKQRFAEETMMQEIQALYTEMLGHKDRSRRASFCEVDDLNP